MNNNVRIARELVKLAKSLVATGDDEKEMQEDVKTLLSINNIKEFNNKAKELNEKWHSRGYSERYFFESNQFKLLKHMFTL